MDLSIKSLIIITCIGVLLLSPFYYLEYIKPMERNKVFDNNYTVLFIHGKTKCYVLYTYRQGGKEWIKVQYENKNSRWVTDAFQPEQLTICKTKEDPPNGVE